MIVTLEFYWQSLNFIFQFGCRPFFSLSCSWSVVRACVCMRPIWLVVFKWICTQTLQFYLRLTGKNDQPAFYTQLFFIKNKIWKKKDENDDDDGNYGYATSSFFFVNVSNFHKKKNFWKMAKLTHKISILKLFLFTYLCFVFERKQMRPFIDFSL